MRTVPGTGKVLQWWGKEVGNIGWEEMEREERRKKKKDKESTRKKFSAYSYDK